jgi:hypothetical protein
MESGIQENLPWLGLGLIYIIDRSVNVLKNRGIDLKRMTEEINEIWEWQRKEAEHLERAIIDLSRSIRIQTDVMKELHIEIRESRRDIRSLDDTSLN